MSKRHILVTGMPPYENGIATSMLNLHRHLDRDRYQMDFLLQSKYKDLDAVDTHQQEIEELGGRVFWSDYSKTVFPRDSRDEIRKILDEHPEIAGVHMCALGLNDIFPVVHAKETGLPIRVIHCHTGIARSSDFKPSETMLANRKMISGEAFVRLACSDLSGKYLYGDAPYTVFPNAVDTGRFRYHPVYRTGLRRSLGIDEHAPVLGMVGEVSDVKNPFYTLNVFREFKKVQKDAVLIIAGSGVMLHEAMEHAQTLGVAASVHFVGIQHQIEMFYNAMDILLMPSRHEGLPNVLVEAQAAGLPVIASDEISGMAALTPLLSFGSIAEDPEEWAKEAESIFTRKGQRRSYSAELKAQGYDIRDSALLLMDIYDAMIQRFKENE